MPSSERKLNIWRSRRRAGYTSRSRTTINQKRHETEYSGAKEICKLRAISSILAEKTERLDQLLQGTLVKLTGVEQAVARKTQAIGCLEDKVAKLERDLQAALHAMVDRGRGNQSDKPLPRAYIGSPDGISVAEVAKLVRELNAQLEQTSCLIADSLSCRQSPIHGRGSEVSNELRDYLGLWLYRNLQRRSSEEDTEPDQLITQVVLQTGLVNACSRIINGWTPPDNIADTWRAQTRSYTAAKSNNQDINFEKYLTRVLRELINAVGGSLQSDEQLPALYQEDVECIVTKAVALHRIINEEVTSLLTYIIPCGTEFDSSRMEDTEGGGGETRFAPHDRVVSTMEMGLQCRENVGPGISKLEYGVIKKAKVVLASTLEVQG